MNKKTALFTALMFSSLLFAMKNNDKDASLLVNGSHQPHAASMDDDTMETSICSQCDLNTYCKRADACCRSCSTSSNNCWNKVGSNVEPMCTALDDGCDAFIRNKYVRVTSCALLSLLATPLDAACSPCETMFTCSYYSRNKEQPHRFICCWTRNLAECHGITQFGNVDITTPINPCS